MKQTERLKRDNLLIDYILQHKGKNNAVHAVEIAEYLNKNNFNVSVGGIHQIINKLKMERHLPICSTIAGGFFGQAVCQKLKNL